MAIKSVTGPGGSDTPTLVMHGDDDQIGPVKNHAEKSAKLIKQRSRSIRARRTATATHQDQVDADLLAVIKASGRPRMLRRLQDRFERGRSASTTPGDRHVS